MARVTVSLPDYLKQFVEAEVAAQAGAFADVVRGERVGVGDGSHAERLAPARRADTPFSDMVRRAYSSLGSQTM